MNEKQPVVQTREHHEDQLLQPALAPEVMLRAEPELTSEEYAAYPAPERVTPDWRRLEVAANRFGDRIAAGLSRAAEQHTGIDDSTARMIAHVLGRALGRESALAGYGRTGTGYYAELRDEYLALYHHTDAGWVTDLIDKYGSYLIRDTYPEAKSTEYGNPDHAKLAHILVPTRLTVGNGHALVHVPGSYVGEALRTLADRLTDLNLHEQPAFRAFLSLPDVNAMSDDIMQHFHANYIGLYPSIEDAIHELSGISDRIEETHEYAAERRLVIDNISPDYEALAEEMGAGFDLVEDDTGTRRTYAFYK